MLNLNMKEIDLLITVVGYYMGKPLLLNQDESTKNILEDIKESLFEERELIIKNKELHKLKNIIERNLALDYTPSDTEFLTLYSKLKNIF